MKRFLIVLFIILIIPLNCFASDNDDYTDYLSSFDYSSFELLDDDTKELLDELGISDFDYESITDLSIETIAAHIFNVLTNQAKGPIKSGIIVLVFTMLSSFFQSMNSGVNKSDTSEIFSTVTSLIISIFLATQLTDCIALCCSTIKLCANFAYAFFPAFCVIVATSGGTLTSFSVNTTLLILAQALNYIAELLFIPITNCFLALGICSSIRKELNLNGLISTLKRLITTAISTISAVFVSILSVKTAVASRADALGLRSVRFAINSVVPVIGSSISEGLLSIQSYSSLIKTSVGIVGIIAVVSVFLPALLEVVAWRFMLSVSSLCCEVFGDTTCTSALKNFRDTLLIMNVLLILTMVATIISIGILIAAKTVN
ncbi:MAG: stage III sporulation protein AE [Clostridiales bacterium]|nr:stage III sporulation protein AE [Clostridiales bacterium]